MAWQKDIPAASDTKNDSQSAMQGNFQAIDTGFNIDHEALNAAVGTLGKHKKLTFPQQGAAPATLAEEFAIYCREDDFTPAAAALFLREESSGTEHNFTTCNLSATDGWARLPCGLLFKWATIAAPGSGTPIVFLVDAAIPVFAATPFMAHVSVVHSATATCAYANLSTTAITPYYSAATSIAYFVVGK